MEAIVTHSDADGIISAALLYRLKPSSSIFFSSNYYLIKTLCNLIIKDYKTVKILDISPSNKSLVLASLFDEVVWIDHHNVDSFVLPNNIKFFNEKTASTARLVSKLFNINDKLVDIADEIDTNNVKSYEAEFFRLLVSALKWKFKTYQNLKLRQIVKTLAFKNLSELEKDVEIAKSIDEYKKWLDEVLPKILSNTKFFKVENEVVAIVESINGVPVYEIYNRMISSPEKNNFDFLAVIYRRLDKRKKTIITKIEFRGRNRKVVELAKKFNGGGHENAAGCIINYYITIEELIKNIENFLKELNS